MSTCSIIAPAAGPGSRSSIGQRDRDEVPGSALGFLRLDDLQRHEEYRLSRQRALCRRMQRDGYLANPLIVSRVGTRLVVLEGDHRLECLRAAGCSHALVQFVPLGDEQRVTLDTWFHVGLVECVDAWLAELFSYGLDIQALAPAAAEAWVQAGRAIAWLGIFDVPRCRAWAIASSGRGHADVLQTLTNLYRPSRLARAELPGRPQALAEIFAANRRANLFVRFARIGREQVARQVQAGERIPAEIMRIVLRRGRVLGVNVPLELLEATVDDAARAGWLAQLQARVPARYPGPSIVYDTPGTRRYEEPLFVYDRAIQPLAT